MIWDAVIFDLDGTLWNAADRAYIAWNEGLRAHGIEPFLTKAHMERQMGRLLPDIAADLFPWMEKGEGLALASECVLIENRMLRKYGGILYPQVPEVLEDLASKVPLAIVSNCENGYIESFFTAHGLGRYFSDYEHPGRTKRPKSGNIQLVMSRNGWKKPIYIGDTQTDRDAAAATGIAFIHADYGFGQVKDCVQLKRFAELPQMLEDSALFEG